MPSSFGVSCRTVRTVYAVGGPTGCTAGLYGLISSGGQGTVYGSLARIGQLYTVYGRCTEVVRCRYWLVYGRLGRQERVFTAGLHRGRSLRCRYAGIEAAARQYLTVLYI